jgi:hypothetical protein
MSATTIPITLIPVTPPVGLVAADMDQLLIIISQYISGQIQANVSFFQEFSAPPSTFNGNLIFVTNLNNFMVWQTSTGTYQPLSQLSIGSVIQQSVQYALPSYDDLLNGWFYLNGRNLGTIVGVSAVQYANLQALYPNGFLPNIQPLAVFPVGQEAAVGIFTSGTGFVNAETATQSVSGATGKVYRDQGPGITNLVMTDITGTANATDVWTGGTSSSVFTPDGTTGLIPYYGPQLVISRVFAGTNIPP